MIIGSTSMMESNPYAPEKPQSLTDKMAENEERREFMQSRVAQQLHEAEIDPEIAFGLDAPPIGIDEMSYTDSTLESDGNWYEASKIVHDYREKINAYDDRPADLRDRTLSILAGPVDPSGAAMTDRKRAMAHDANEISEYGIEYAGYLTHNFTGSTIEFSKADEMPQEVALATAALLEMYDRTPDVSWPGTFRFLKNAAIDPPNAVGLGNLKIVGELIKAGGKGAMKKRLMQIALGSSVIGAEGSAYAAWSDYVQQRMRFQPPSDDELRDMDYPGEERTFQPDYDSIGQSAALGYALGSGLTAAATQARPVVGAARDAFNRAVYGDLDGGAVLRSGIGPTDKIGLDENQPSATVDTRRIGDVIEISRITTPEELRGQGFAEQKLLELIKQADAENVSLALTPSDAFGANKSRLSKWYKRHGFVPNKGRNKNFTTKEALIRPPSSQGDLFTEPTE
jgi:GNAT superfamily N-acetyltransferase|tara:strand:+ start:2222 stop:3586 length:1365 start_codon:yes stop_codon:yes gene_type:complete